MRGVKLFVPAFVALTCLLLANPAQAAPPLKQLDIAIQGSGSVTLSPSGGAYARGTAVTMTASAAAGWNFDHWTGPTVDGSTANPQIITMYNNYKVTAVFKQPGGGITVRKTNAVIRVVNGSGQPVTGVDVQVDMTQIAFGFGTAVAAGALSLPQYANWLKNNYNWAVPENDAKWPQNEPVQGLVSYTNADAIYNFAAANNIRMRGHAVFWAVPEFVQQWVKDLPNSTDLQAAVDARLNDVVPHFKLKFEHWDVNNEMLHGSFFVDRLGTGIRPYMFNQVKFLDPGVKTFVNDYNIIAGGSDLNAYVTQITNLRTAGAHIDGIGVQGHFSGGDTMAQITQRLDTLAAFGLPIWVTEYDYANSDPVARANYLEAFYRTAFAHPSVEGILMWGFWAGAHWRGADAALLDTDFTVNAAGQRYQALRAEWWTNTAGSTDANGEFSYNGYFGDYVITLSTASGSLVETFDVTLVKGVSNPVVTLVLGSGTPADVLPPVPNPPTWVASPIAVSDDAIAMTATTASDASAVEYYFSNLGNPSHDSGWRDSPVYIDTGLAAASSYTYTVVARDKSIAHNTTSVSAPAAATTAADDGNLLVNGGFEYGTTQGWVAVSGAALQVQTDTVRSGSFAGRATGRTQAYDGFAQDLASQAVKGATWQCSGWVRLDNAGSEPVGMTMLVRDNTGDNYVGIQWGTANDTQWTQISGPIILNYSGTLTTLRLYFEGPAPGLNYLLDDVQCSSNAPLVLKMYVSDIAMIARKKGPNNYVEATVRILNESGTPLAGISVSGNWSGVVGGATNGTTANDGRVTLSSPRTRNSGTFTFTVTAVLGSGYEYNPALNVKSSATLVVP